MLMLTAERLHTPLAVLILSHSQLLKIVRKQYLRKLLTKKQRKPQRQPNRQKRLPSLQQLPAKENKTETKATTKPVEEKEEETQPTESVQTYLVNIDNPDISYSPSRVTLSDYDRAKLERLVMGEAGTMGYEGCALVAQSIRDAMNLSGNTSIDYIIDEYKYYAPTNIEPNSDVKAAVSYIFDNNGSAVQHRIICFYTGESKWHETQNFIISCGNVRFFDLAV